MKLEKGMHITCIDHPNWGIWTVLRHYTSNIWEIRGRSGDRILDQWEADKFWKGGEI